MTIGFGEWKIGSGNNAAFTIPSDIIFTNSFPAGVTRNTATMNLPLANANSAVIKWLGTTCAGLLRSAGNRSIETAMLGEDWAFGLPAYSLGTIVAPPNSKYPACLTAAVDTQDSPGAYGLNSYHPGGANAVMCDGSVRFLKDSIGLNTLWALGSRAQGEIVSADSY
jgi:prepilin-type processing-associated H-X9-DG protein